MKDKLLRKLLIEQGIIRVIAEPGPFWYKGLMEGRSVDVAYNTPRDMIAQLSVAVQKLAKDQIRLLTYLGLEMADIPLRPEMRVIRKKKK